MSVGRGKNGESSQVEARKGKGQGDCAERWGQGAGWASRGRTTNDTQTSYVVACPGSAEELTGSRLPRARLFSWASLHSCSSEAQTMCTAGPRRG